MELKWLIRILLKDLRISLKENSILECFHPDAKDLFDHTSNLYKVAVYLHDIDKRLHEIGLSLFSPFRPMLGKDFSMNYDKTIDLSFQVNEHVQIKSNN